MILTHILYAFVFFVGTAAGLVSLALPKPKPHHFHHLLTLGASYLFAIILIQLLPELFRRATGEEEQVGYFLMVGFLLQVLLDMAGGSLVHGHDIMPTGQFAGRHFLFPLFGTLGVHAFLEGFLISEKDWPISIAILLHKLPITLTLIFFFQHQGYSKRAVILLILLFAAFTPMGYLSYHYYEYIADENNIRQLTPIVALATGSLFHVGTTILMESNPHHHLVLGKCLSLFAGAILAVISHYFLHFH